MPSSPWYGLLTKSADQIAEILKAQGIKGTKFSGANCPLAAYALKRGAVDVSVNNNWLSYWTGSYSPMISRPTTRGTRAFVRKFDLGAYPDLEA